MGADVHPHPRAAAPDVEVQRIVVRPLFTKLSASEYLGISERTLDRIVRDGELPAYRVRGQLRFRFDDIERYLAAQRLTF